MNVLGVLAVVSGKRILERERERERGGGGEE